MNNRGFTLVESLGVVVIISLVLILLVRNFSSTVSLSKEEAYKIMKNNIVSASYDYVNECISGVISCDFSFENNNRFSAKILKENGYFKSFKSPIDGKNLEDCLIVEVKKNNGVVVTDLVDYCY